MQNLTVSSADVVLVPVLKMPYSFETLILVIKKSEFSHRINILFFIYIVRLRGSRKTLPELD